MLNQTELFETVKADSTSTSTVRVVFYGGTSCNVPRLGFGDGYGSYQIDNHQIRRVKFGSMSANCAEVLTLCSALEEAILLFDPNRTGLIITGDSMIALRKAATCFKYRKIDKKIKANGTQEFKDAVAQLTALVKQFGSVRTQWWRRENSVAIFGH